MASSVGGGGGRRSPPAAATAAPPRVVVMDSLMEVHEGATRLQTMLQESQHTPSSIAAAAGTTTIIDGIMSSLSSAMSALDTTGAGAGQGQGRRRRRRGGAAAAGGSGPQRRMRSTRRRSHSPFVNTVTTDTLNDGKSWRKYGQKLIQESTNPRSYYRCTHRPEQGCMATRQVQVSDANPSEFIISYYGHHSCQDPSTIPLVIPDTAPPPDCANLISFGSTTTTTTTIAGGASSSSTATAVPPQSFDPTTTAMFMSRFGGYSSSLPAAPPAQVQQDYYYRCGSEEALSSSSMPAAQLAGAAAAAAVVGSAGKMASSAATVGSAPAEYSWPGGTTSDMACGSFPSSPSSLGFMTSSPFGSFGNAGDDDLFGFDL